MVSVTLPCFPVFDINKTVTIARGGFGNPPPSGWI